MLAPGHYSGTGRGVLGAIAQEVGVFVCINELAYAIAMTVPASALVNAKPRIRTELKKCGVRLLRAVGSFNILNYEEGLREVHKRAEASAITRSK